MRVSVLGQTESTLAARILRMTRQGAAPLAALLKMKLTHPVVRSSPLRRCRLCSKYIFWGSETYTYRPIFTTNQALNHSTAVGTHYLRELFTGLAAPPLDTRPCISRFALGSGFVCRKVTTSAMLTQRSCCLLQPCSDCLQLDRVLAVR